MGKANFSQGREKLRIAFVYDSIFPFTFGGGEKRNWEIARRLARKHEVHIYGMKFWTGEKCFEKEKVSIKGTLPGVAFFTSGGRRSLGQPVLFALSLFQPLLRNSYHIIDCVNIPFFPAIVCAICARLKGARLVVTWLEVWADYWFEYLGWKGIFGYLLEIIVSRLTNHHIAISSFTAEKLRKKLKVRPEKIVVSPVGIENKQLRDIFLDKQKGKIIYAGRLVEHKHVDWLVEVLPGILKEVPCAFLRIVGDGPERGRLLEKAKELKLEDKIIFSTFIVDQDQWGREIKSSEVFVLPSSREGQGVALIESMALGTAVVALDAEESAARSLIRNRFNGLLVTRENLARTLIQILRNSVLRNSLVENGYRTASTYDWDEGIFPSLEGYYEKMRFGIQGFCNQQ